MIANLLLAGWVAAAATWTPMSRFSMVCTGTQTAYQETTGVKMTLPWQETFSIDLVGGSFCSQGCARSKPLRAITLDGLDLENSTAQYSSSLRRFHAQTGAIETNIVTAASLTDRIHLELAGTCKIQPPTGGT